MSDFEKQLEELINRHNKERESSTPDFILANYLINCLGAYNAAVSQRDKWYGVDNDKAEEGELPA